MVSGSLKKIRVIVSLLSIVLITVLFLDFGGMVSNVLSPVFYKIILFCQFLPSLKKWLNLPEIASIGWLFVLGLSIVFGRVYCSFLCPLGCTMDLCARTNKTKNRYKWSKPYPVFRLVILIVTTVSLFAGFTSVVSVLDPFSQFGRILSELLRPVVSFAINSLSFVLERFDSYAVSPVKVPETAYGVAGLAVAIMGLIFILAYKRGRIYCNTLCPVGTLLGLISRKSLFQININPDTCVSCGICEKQCKAECIDLSTMKIDYQRCVVCFNCLSQCPAGAINFLTVKTTDEVEMAEPETAMKSERRHVLKTVFLGAFAMVLTLPKQVFSNLAIEVFSKNKIKVNKTIPIVPPGGHGISHFTKQCLACHLCVTACPGNVIRPRLIHYGAKAFLVPTMDAKSGYCLYECNQCGKVCPSGAITPFDLEEKKRIRIGAVSFIRENCIVMTQKTECGACAEICPTQAVYMVRESMGLRVPHLNTDYCIGCNACEHVCPSKPNKSIYVDGCGVHEAALKPVAKKKKEPEPDEDFPF